MTLSKNETQKIVLSGIALVAVIYVFFAFFLNPLEANREKMQVQIADYEAKLAGSAKVLHDVEVLSRSAQTATAHFADLTATIPDGAPVAWFPPRMKQFFAGEGVVADSIHLIDSAPFNQPELDRFASYNWSVALESVPFPSFAQALAQLRLQAIVRRRMTSCDVWRTLQTDGAPPPTG